MNIAARAGRWSAPTGRPRPSGGSRWSSRRDRRRERGGDRQAEPTGTVDRPGGAGPGDARTGRLPRTRERDRARAEPTRMRSSPRRSGGELRDGGRGLEGPAADQSIALAAVARQRRPVLEGRPLGAGGVRNEGRRRRRRRTASSRCSTRSSSLQRSAPGFTVAGVRRRERRTRGQPSTVNAGLRAAPRSCRCRSPSCPADRVRRVRRGRHAGAARVLGGARLGRAGGARQPRSSTPPTRRPR